MIRHRASLTTPCSHIGSIASGKLQAWTSPKVRPTELEAGFLIQEKLHSVCSTVPSQLWKYWTSIPRPRTWVSRPLVPSFSAKDGV
jgi:fructose-1,6-bisphosphatase/inositol monophosphatase family enzyme